MFQIFVDSAANLPAVTAKQYDIHVISFVNLVDGKEITCFDPNLSPEEERQKGTEYYQAMSRGCEIKTGLISTAAFEEAFRSALEADQDVLYFSLSKNISGTYNSARLASEELLDEFGDKHKIRLVDSLNASLAQGILAVYASEMRTKGMSVDEVADTLEYYVGKMERGNMKEKVMSAMQSFSKAMFMPVLILPIAGLLIAVGNVLTNARLMEILPFLDNPVTKGFGTILSGALVAILNNLGLIFCTGIAIGLAKKKKAEAGFTALLAFLVFINAMNKFMGLRGMLVDADALRGSGQAVVLGIQILDMGVFLGIILGCVSAYVHNRFIDTEFNNAFQIYGGARFVFIVLIPVIIILAVVLTYVWPPVQMVIDSLGYFINRTGNFGIFIYGALERLLIPTGLHHLVYTPFLYTKLGGTEQIAGQVYEGCRNIYYAEMADPSIPILSSSVVWDARGLSKMFGLVGACLAMYHTARPENRQKIKAILIPAAFTSFIAGVTEPIEFSFLFVAPILFVAHAVLSGLGMVVFNILNCRAIGPNGFIDFLLYNIPLGIGKTHWPIYLLIGVAEFVIYYFLFRFLITKLNLKTLGREDNGMEMKLHTKAEYKEKTAKASTEKTAASEKGEINAKLIVEALGGPDNIEKVDNCFTRLRLIVKDSSIVKDEVLKQKTGAAGVFKKNETVQVVYGLQINQVRKAVDKELGLDQ